MADAFVTLDSGALRARQGDKGELAGPNFWQAVITRTPTVTTNVMSVYLTADGTSTGRKLFARTPAVSIVVLKNKAGGNAAITDFRGAWPMTYAEGTGLLTFAAIKGATDPAILASGDGEHTFLITAIGL